MKLENERLRIRFALPEEMRTQRFDHTAMVTDVVLDNAHRFCTVEQVRPDRRSTYGMGLCGEFVLEGAAEEAEKGEWFCKPGVGALRQTASGAPYDLWQSYECRPSQVTAQQKKHGIIFRQKAVPCGGCGVDIEKEFSLQGNRLILDITAENTGEKPVCLREYQHNFLSLDEMPVSKGYVLSLNCDENLEQILHKTLRQGDEIVLPSAVQVQGDEILWERDLEGRVIYHSSQAVKTAERYGWKLHHTEKSVSVSEETAFKPDRVDIWAVEHCVSAELYHTVQLAPGEKACWRRTWTFED